MVGDDGGSTLFVKDRSTECSGARIIGIRGSITNPESTTLFVAGHNADFCARISSDIYFGRHCSRFWVGFRLIFVDFEEISFFLAGVASWLPFSVVAAANKTADTESKLYNHKEQNDGKQRHTQNEV